MLNRKEITNMLIKNILQYEKHQININKPIDDLYYYFDYDERTANINMEFQHFHPFYELCILLDDTMNHIIEGVPYAMQCLDIVALRPSLLHKTQYFDGFPSKRLIIQFHCPPMPEPLMEEFSDMMTVFDASLPIYRFEPEYQEKLFAPLNDIFYSTYEHSRPSRLYCHSRFMEFMLQLSRLRYNNIYRPKNLENSSHKIYEITSYIHNNYMNGLSLSSLAESFYMSTYYLSHQFKEVTGFTLTNYIQLTRIRNAQQMLLFTSRKITDVAEACGFTSFSQFNRMFRKFCSISPREFKAYGQSMITAPTSADIPEVIKQG